MILKISQRHRIADLVIILIAYTDMSRVQRASGIILDTLSKLESELDDVVSDKFDYVIFCFLTVQIIAAAKAEIHCQKKSGFSDGVFTLLIAKDSVQTRSGPNPPSRDTLSIYGFCELVAFYFIQHSAVLPHFRRIQSF